MKSRTITEIGQRFGHLVFTGNKKNEDKRWLGEFTCDCGTVCYRRLDGVANGNNKSCGCKSPNKDYKNKQREMGKDYPFLVICNYSQKNAKTRKIEFTITFEDIKRVYEEQNGLCVYTKEKLELPKNFLHLNGLNILSIDRIDSNTGYIPGNIQLVKKTVNFMKQTLSHLQFLETCKLIASNF